MTVRGRVFLLAVAVCMLLAVLGGASAGAQTANDPFATATIVSSTAGTVQPGALFDGSIRDPGSVTFFPGDEVGSESEVVFDTASTTVNGIRVHAANDGPGLGFRRAMSRFQFFADKDQDGALAAAERLVDRTVDVRYPEGRPVDPGPGRAIELSFDFPAPVTARRWRVVVTQGTDVGAFDGVRIGEIDATPPPPRSTTLTVAPSLGALFSLRARLTETTTGAPIPDRTVTMATSAGAACRAVTGPDGVATCSGVGTLAQILLENGYTASFAGDGQFRASSARANLLVGGVSSSPPAVAPPVVPPVPPTVRPSLVTPPTAVAPATSAPPSRPVTSRPAAQPVGSGRTRTDGSPSAPSPPPREGSASPAPGSEVTAEGPTADGGERVTPRRSTFVESVIAPSEVSLSPTLLAQNLAITAGLILLVAFPANLFNATAHANYEEISRWKAFAWSAGLRERVADISDAVKVPVFAGAGALIYAQLSPDFGLNRRSSALLVGMLCSLVLLWLVDDASRAFYLRRYDVPSAVRTQPLLLLLAIALVALSRLADFAPGYVYGLFTAVVHLRPVDERLQGRALALASVLLGGLAVVAWFIWDPVRDIAERPGAGFAVLSLDAFLAAFWVSALGTVVFGLVPLRFLRGDAIRRWSTGGWLAIFGLALMTFLHTMAHPERGFYTRADVPLPVVLVPFVAFGISSVAFWGYFRLRAPAAAMAPRAP